MVQRQEASDFQTQFLHSVLLLLHLLTIQIAMAKKAAAKMRSSGQKVPAGFRSTLGPDTDTAEGTAIPCDFPGCSRVQTSWKQLVKHYTNFHLVPRASLKGSYALEQCNASRRKCHSSFDTLEWQHVSPAGDGNVHEFTCNACQAQLSKTSAFRHFTVAPHRLDSGRVRKWVVMTDSNTIGNHSKKPLELEALYEKEMLLIEQAGLPASPECDEEQQSGADTTTNPIGSSMTADMEDIQPHIPAASINRSSSSSSKCNSTKANQSDDVIAARVSSNDLVPTSIGSSSASGSTPAPHAIPEQALATATGASVALDAVVAATETPAARIEAKLDKLLQHDQKVTMLLEQTPEVEVPMMTLSAECVIWEEDDKWAQRKRNDFPKEIECQMLEHESYEKEMRRLELEDTTVKARKLSIGRLWGMLLVHEPGCSPESMDHFGTFAFDWDPLNILLGIEKCGIMSELQDTKLFAPSRSWTNKLLFDLKDLIDFEHKRCLTKGWKNAAAKLTKLKAADMASYGKIANKKKHESTLKRNKDDTKRLKEFPSKSFIKESVQRAMVHLQLLADKWEGHDRMDIPEVERAHATTCMCAILYLNGHGGRSQEWQDGLAQHVMQVLNSGVDFIEFSKHKTAHVYGDVVKWLAPGTISAAHTYSKIPGGSCPKFLKPVRAATKMASIAHFLHRFGVLFWGKKDQYPTVNLCRKRLHTELDKRTRKNDVKKLMTAVDRNSPHVAGKHYVCTDPADEAEIIEAVYKDIIGQPVEWPAKEDMDRLVEEEAPLLRSMLYKRHDKDDPMDDTDLQVTDDELEAGFEFAPLWSSYNKWLAEKLSTLPVGDVERCNSEEQQKSHLEEGVPQSSSMSSNQEDDKMALVLLAESKPEVPQKSTPSTFQSHHRKKEKQPKVEPAASDAPQASSTEQVPTSSGKKRKQEGKRSSSPSPGIITDADVDGVEEYEPSLTHQKWPLDPDTKTFAWQAAESHFLKHGTKPNGAWYNKLWKVGVQMKVWHRHQNPSGIRNHCVKLFLAHYPESNLKKQHQ